MLFLTEPLQGGKQAKVDKSFLFLKFFKKKANSTPTNSQDLIINSPLKLLQIPL